MKTSKNEMLRSIINDALRGEVTPLRGLVTYLRHDLGYPIYRIVGIGKRRFGLPTGVIYQTLAGL